MEDTLIKFETAKLAKEKLFPQSRKAKGKFRDDGSTENLGIGGAMIDTCKEWYERPTQSLLAKWLRERYNIHVTSQIGNLDFINTYHYEIRYVDKNKFMCKVNGNFKTYEEALEIGLQKALNLI